MQQVKKYGIILKPTNQDFEKTAVLNPGVYKDGDYVHIFYRAIDSQNRSSIGYAKLRGPIKVVERRKSPFIEREFEYEKMGVEDPRIVKLGKTFYMFYVAHDGKNAITAYATSKDLLHFKKRGVISPKISYHTAEKLFRESRLKDAYYFFSSYYQDQAGNDVLLWEKDIFLFPKKFHGKFALIHRVLPDIQIVLFKSFKELTTDFWKNEIRHLSKDVLLEGSHWYETRNIGGGCPPIETKDGWVLIFHTVEETNKGRVYRASAALLDKDNPKKVIARLHEPLFSPEEKWEKRGFVSNVVFPTGTALFKDTLYIYYGAADKHIAVASVKLKDLIYTMKTNKHSHMYEKP